jgi:hypothetical protein
VGHGGQLDAATQQRLADVLEAAVALKAEARRRVAAGTFFGHITYASPTARRPSRAHRPTAAGPG